METVRKTLFCHFFKLFEPLLSISNLTLLPLILGTRHLYNFIRQELKIPFYHGQGPMDKWIDAIFKAIQDGKLDDVILDMFANRDEI